MQTRIYTFIAGIDSSLQPDPGTPTQPHDIVPYSYITATYSKRKRVTGASNAPYAAQAGTAIAHALASDEDEGIIYVQGDGGAVDMSGNPQIAAGTRNGQRLTLIGCSSTNTVKFEDGDGLKMNGEKFLGANQAIEFIWDSVASLWIEQGRQ